MPVWERYHGEDTLGAVGTNVNTEIFFNTQADENFEASDVVGVDGILTVLTDTDALCGVRLIVAPSGLVSGDLTEDIPNPHDRMIWYSWFVGRGPMVFRLRSKKTIPPEYKLWMQSWKAAATLSTEVRWGLHVLWVVKH